MKPSLTITSQILFAAVLGLSSISAQAVLLNAGDTGVSLPGTTVAAEPQLAGTIIIDEAIPFSFSAGPGLGNISGQVQQRIVRSSVDNTLDFYWRVQNDATSASAIGSFRLGDFVSPEYNANWRSDGLGDTAPSDATRFAGILESFVNFDFNVHSTDPADGLLPGESSYFMFLDTTAINFAKTAKFDLTNMVQNPISGQFAAYSPTPVPPAVWLFGSGLLGLIGTSRRTRSA